MTPLSYDLVIQGKDLSRSNLPAEAAGLAGFIAEIAPGAVRLESVNPLTAEPVIGRLQEAGLDAAMVRHGLKLTEFRLLASDLDSTLVAIETLDTVAKNAGYGDTVAQVTEAAMRGDIKDYAESLRLRIAAVKGCPVKAFTDFAETMPYSPGAERWVKSCRAASLECHIVTGGFDEVAAAAAEKLGANGFHCNKLGIRDGVLDGTVTGPKENGGKIVDSDGKRHIVEQLAADRGIPACDVITMGDGWNDVKMLEFAGLGIAYHAKPRVRALIPHQINSLGLDSALNWFADGPYWAERAGV